MAIVADQKEAAGSDLFIDARAILGRRGLITLKTSGNYDSLLGFKPRDTAFRWSDGAKRNELRSWASAIPFAGRAGMAAR
jgi:hypothetical protein